MSTRYRHTGTKRTRCCGRLWAQQALCLCWSLTRPWAEFGLRRCGKRSWKKSPAFSWRSSARKTARLRRFYGSIVRTKLMPTMLDIFFPKTRNSATDRILFAIGCYLPKKTSPPYWSSRQLYTRLVHTESVQQQQAHALHIPKERDLWTICLCLFSRAGYIWRCCSVTHVLCHDFLLFSILASLLAKLLAEACSICRNRRCNRRTWVYWF